jgi:hypothetical protein
MHKCKFRALAGMHCVEEPKVLLRSPNCARMLRILLRQLYMYIYIGCRCI